MGFFLWYYYILRAPKNFQVLLMMSTMKLGKEKADSSVIYNIYGQRVDETYRGIVIKNGKKYIQK